MVSEFKKIFNIKLVIIILVMLIGFEAGYSVIIYGVKNADNAELKEQLYSEYGGKITEESARRLEEYNAYVDGIMMSDTEMEDKYNKGSISADEYMEYREQYHYCNRIQKLVNSMWKRCNDEKDTSGYLLNDGYYNRLFLAIPGLICIALIGILIAVMLRLCETEGLYSVITATADGRRKLMRDKCLLITVSMAAVSLVYIAVRYGITSIVTDYINTEAPIQAVDILEKLPFGINIKQYMVIDIISKPLWGVLTGNLAVLLLSRKR